MPLNSYLLTSKDGVKFNFQLCVSVTTPSQPIILCLPAMGVPARKYQLLAETLFNNGLASAIFELRGIDTSSVRASRQQDFGYYEILNYDLPVAINKIRSIYPENPLYFLGHSLGGQLGFMYLSQNPEQIDGLIGVGTGTPYYKGWSFPQNLSLLLGSQFINWVSLCLGYFPGRRFGFAGREARQLMRDWSHSIKTGHYKAKGSSVEFDRKAAMIEKKVLLITIEKDQFAPLQSTKNLGNKLKQSEVVYHHLTTKDFINDSIGHFKWMKEPNPIVQKIKSWLTN